MPKPIVLRAEPIPERLVVLRMGVNTLTDDALAFTCANAYAEWGLYAFSVLELPHGGWEELARAMPEVRRRPLALEASGPELIRAGFPLLPTNAWLHWSIVLSEPTSEQFARVRPHFHGPVNNPVWRGRSA